MSAILKSDKIVSFTDRCQVIKGSKKPKQKRLNGKRGQAGRTKTMESLTTDELKAMELSFRQQLESAGTNIKYEKAARNYLLFVIGLNVGIRGIDLVALKWSDFYYSDGTLRDKVEITEHKTDKHKVFKLNQSAKEVLSWYVEEFFVDVFTNDYLFEGQDKLDGKKIEGHISTKTLERILKKVGKDAGVRKPVATHTLRKTFARHQIEAHPNDSLFLISLMQLLNHTSPLVTLAYAGVGHDEMLKYYDDVNLGNWQGSLTENEKSDIQKYKGE